MQTKICTKCHIEKPISEFANAKTGVFGKRGDCKKCRNKISYNFYKENKYDIIEYRKQNSLKIKQQQHDHYLRNKKKILKRNKIYYLKNKEKINKLNNVNAVKRYKNNVNVRIERNLRSRLKNALKTKTQKTLDLLGCSTQFLKNHLESMFQEGMSWNNYGKWHIDHIRPCAIFDLADPDQQRICFNYTNLQPLWAVDNLKKSNKY